MVAGIGVEEHSSPLTIRARRRGRRAVAFAGAGLLPDLDAGVGGWRFLLGLPGLYGLGSQVGQFRQIDRTFDHERVRFNTLIGPERTTLIVGDRIAKARQRYWWWFRLTADGYAIAIGAAIAAAVLVPSIIT